MTLFPSSIESFREIREEKRLYADKTEFIHRLIMDGRFFCLFRPKGFGKTLLISTLEELFLGNSAHFKSLFIHGASYDFRKYPVISLDLSAFNSESPVTFREELSWEIKRIAINNEVIIRGTSPSTLLSWLIDALSLKFHNKVVLLIDEVDSPVTTNLDNPPLRMENAKAMEAFLSALLAKRDKIRFSFLAGVIKPFDEFGQKLSTLFKDISLSTRYGGICGITVEEFFKLYKEPLGEILDLLRREDEISPIKTIEDLKNEIVTWYQGYSFDGESKVYDPTSLNTFLENAAWDYYFAEKRLDPSLLKDTIKTPELLFPRDDLTFSRGSLLSVKDFSPVSPTLLYQKGIFTISEKREEQGVTEYVLGFPNHEVERSFHLLALEKLSGEDEPKVTAFIRDFKEKATNAEHEALAYTLKNFLLKASSYLHFKENKVSNANASESSNEKNKDLNRRKGADKKIVRKEKRSRLDIKKDDRNEESGIFLSDFERYPSKLTLGSEDYQQKEEELSPHIKGLSSRITAILNLILSLSGFHLKRQIPDSLTAQGVLKHPSGGKSILINLKYFPLSNTLPVGGRIRLLNEALSEALEKAANSSQVILSSSQKEVKEIYLFVAGEFDVIAGVYSRQGGFFWRPLSKAPGAF